MKSWLHEVTTSSVSTLAAMSCTRRPVPAAFRLNRLLRASTRRGRWFAGSRSTKSPTVAWSSSPSATSAAHAPRTRSGDVEAVPVHRQHPGGQKRFSLASVNLRGEVVRPAEFGQPVKNVRHWFRPSLAPQDAERTKTAAGKAGSGEFVAGRGKGLKSGCRRSHGDRARVSDQAFTASPAGRRTMADMEKSLLSAGQDRRGIAPTTAVCKSRTASAVDPAIAVYVNFGLSLQPPEDCKSEPLVIGSPNMADAPPGPPRRGPWSPPRNRAIARPSPPTVAPSLPAPWRSLRPRRRIAIRPSPPRNQSLCDWNALPDGWPSG